MKIKRTVYLKLNLCNGTEEVIQVIKGKTSRRVTI